MGPPNSQTTFSLRTLFPCRAQTFEVLPECVGKFPRSQKHMLRCGAAPACPCCRERAVLAAPTCTPARPPSAPACLLVLLAHPSTAWAESLGHFWKCFLVTSQVLENSNLLSSFHQILSSTSMPAIAITFFSLHTP